MFWILFLRYLSATAVDIMASLKLGEISQPRADFKINSRCKNVFNSTIKLSF